nr:hypothetical protein [Serratia fonticola]
MGKIYGYGLGVTENLEKAMQYYQALEKIAPEFAKPQVDSFNAYKASKNKAA